MRFKKIIAGIAAAAILCGIGFTASAEGRLADSDVSELYGLNTESHGYGQGVECDEDNCPTGAKMFNDEYNEYDSYAVFEDTKGVCLTFDQGYENGYTPSILDTLEEKNVKAVFFLTGDYAKRNKDLVKRMIDEGHIIGNHGMKHESLPSLSPEDAAEEIMSLHDYVKQEYGYEMTYFRPPCGEYSEQSMAVCQRLGYKTMLWSFAYCDWDVNNQPDAASALERVSGAAHDGAIYLLHSVSETNAEILPQVIDNIRKQGYDFVLPAFTIG
ncbi:MAG: polysaccharide deacetylase family protein [Oscillospiraceae bacterium]|nr:polysaccharide deacetylase family protein [Oscillospiraceae bacterium]